MRFRSGVFSLAVLVLASHPVAAEPLRAEPSPTAASLTLHESSAVLDSVSITIAPRYEMSWGNSASGNALQVKDTIAEWPAYHAGVDASFNTSAEVADAHKTQVASAVDTIGKLVDSYPEGSVFSISANGSINTDGRSSGSVVVSYNVSVPVSDSAPAASDATGAGS